MVRHRRRRGLLPSPARTPGRAARGTQAAYQDTRPVPLRLRAPEPPSSAGARPAAGVTAMHRASAGLAYVWMSRQLARAPAIVKPGVARMGTRMDDIAVTPPVARQDGIALWRQIADRLQHDIGSGVYAPGGRLPTEAEMSQQFR